MWPDEPGADECDAEGRSETDEDCLVEFSDRGPVDAVEDGRSNNASEGVE